MKVLTRPAAIAAALSLSVAGLIAGATGASASAPAAPAATAVFRQMQNAEYSECVTALSGQLNAPLVIRPCLSDSSQAWVFVPTGAPNTFFIVNQSTGFCMEVKNGTSSPREAVIGSFCNGQASEKWVVDDFRLRHLGTNQCLDTVAGPSSALMQFTCGEARPPNVQFWIIG